MVIVADGSEGNMLHERVITTTFSNQKMLEMTRIHNQQKCKVFSRESPSRESRKVCHSPKNAFAISIR